MERNNIRNNKEPRKKTLDQILARRKFAIFSVKQPAIVARHLGHSGKHRTAFFKEYLIAASTVIMTAVDETCFWFFHSVADSYI